MSTSRPDIRYIRPRFSTGGEGVFAAFTTRETLPGAEGGDTAVKGFNLGTNTADPPGRVARNRRRLCRALERDEEWLALAEQVHGTRVRTVTEGGTYPDTDGLVTRIPGLTLGIQVADCAALLLWEPEAEVVGAAHAGWRGAAGDIVDVTLRAMEREGAEAGRIRAFLSPCISAEHFEVGKEVAELFPAEFVRRGDFEKPHVDLKGFLRGQLAAGGVPPGHVEVHPGCTYSDHEYYSYRRQGERSGRMMGLVALSNHG